MATEITMPRLSDSMEEGTILHWIADEGAEVKRGEPLVEIETDKANMTYESDTDGTLVEIVAQEGDTLPIGAVIARIGDASERSENGASRRESKDEESDDADDGDGDGDGDGEEAAAEDDEPTGADEEDGEAKREEDREPAEEPAAKDGDRQGRKSARSGDGARDSATAEEERQPSADEERDEADEDGGRVKASPVARRMAQELGVELGRLEGSGPGGRIVKADVEAAASGDGRRERAGGDRAEEEAPAAEEAGEAGREEEREPSQPQPVAAGEAGPKGEVQHQDLSRTQRTISRRMAESKATAPDFQLQVDIDMSRCVELRARLRDLSDALPSFNDMVIKACALTLREFPRVNGAYRDGRFELYSRVNVGVAVAAHDALVVPTVFDADRRSLGEIARQVRELAGKVRDGKITPPEVSGATFTVSNLGMYGIDSFSAIINPPQAALLAVGALKKRPVVDESGRIVARDMMSATLVCDHRILYGADGAEFLAETKRRLEQPLSFAL